MLPQPPVPGPGLAKRMAEAAKRMVCSALRAFEEADERPADSMMKPLALLCVAGKGGQTLKVRLDCSGRAGDFAATGDTQAAWAADPAVRKLLDTVGAVVWQLLADS